MEKVPRAISGCARHPAARCHIEEVLLEEQGTKVAVRTEYVGVCGKVFKAIGVAVPTTIRIVGK